MITELRGVRLEISLEYRKGDHFLNAPEPSLENGRNEAGLRLSLGEPREAEGAACLPYEISVDAPFATQARLRIRPLGEKDVYHVIPCNIYGDNNAAEAHAGEFPLLTKDCSDGDVFKAPRWEYRADRAAMPVSALCCSWGTVAVSVDPYSVCEAPVVFTKAEGLHQNSDHFQDKGNPGSASGDDAVAMYDTGKLLHNGVFAELPDVCGVTLGYTNDPVSFVNKRTPGPSTWQMAKKASVRGRIYICRASDLTQEDISESDAAAWTAGKSGTGADGSLLSCSADRTDGRTAQDLADYAQHPYLTIHRIIRAEYDLRHERASYRKSFRDAVAGCFGSFRDINWSEDWKEYTNCNCLPPANHVLRPWRQVVEIGWTGGAVLAYPMVLAQDILAGKQFASAGEASADPMLACRPAGGFQDTDKSDSAAFARSGYEMIDRIIASYNDKSGLLNDLTHPIDDSGSLVNGWWSGFGLTKDVHCSYNVGSALHYILKTVDYLERTGRFHSAAGKKHSAAEADGSGSSVRQGEAPHADASSENAMQIKVQHWLEVCSRVMDTVIDLQREDGAFGYTYYSDHKGVADWNGFAGCWFVPAAAYLYHFTGNARYLQAAERGLAFYQKSVEALHCCGTPMDTWKAMDEEGNLAFLRGARLLQEYTGEKRFLQAMEESADWEFLWRYGYRTKPDFRPLNDGWNSCGGSVTSVSNPHIHPMGMIVDSDLYYLGRVTGDDYYTERAMDGTAWIMQTLELYPEKTGYGQYGVLSERWCPSDGLVIQRDSDGKPYSSWFSYNLWAAAAAFEEVCEREIHWNE